LLISYEGRNVASKAKETQPQDGGPCAEDKVSGGRVPAIFNDKGGGRVEVGERQPASSSLFCFIVTGFVSKWEECKKTRCFPWVGLRGEKKRIEEKSQG